MANIMVNKKDATVMNIIHYFVCTENYKPIIVNGVQNEIWLENFENDVKLIRININYIHNDEQYKVDLRKANAIMRNIKKKTYSFNMNLLNILVDLGDTVTLTEEKNIESVKVSKLSDLKKNKTVLDFFPKISTELNSKKANLDEIVKMSNEMNEKNYKEEKKLNKLFKSTTPVVTYSIIFINILVYLLMLVPNIYVNFINMFANYYVNVQIGEVWRLITSAFLHGSILHLGFNMYALYVIGPLCERYYGKGKFFLIYTLSAVIGSLFSVVLGNNVSIGASGAIFGLFGAILYFGFNYRATLDGFLRGNIIPVIIINLIIGFMVPNIDVFAHIGGLIGGYLASMLCGIKGLNKKQDKINGLVMTIILIAFLGYMLMAK